MNSFANMVNRALAENERRTLSPAEGADDADEATKPFIDMDIPKQLDILADYFRKNPSDVSNAGEYIATIPSQQLLTIMLHGNPSEIHTFHMVHFIEFFAQHVQTAIDKGEIA